VKFLLDACTFLWFAADAPELSTLARNACVDPDSELYLSVVSAWELASKHNAGRLPLPEPAATYIPGRRAHYGIVSLELTEEAIWQLPKLPPIHRDPFDRILICQAIVHGLIILTPDEHITQYPVRVMW
jgi:PIN domain nuclease of toxin-antitoxin system